MKSFISSPLETWINLKCLYLIYLTHLKQVEGVESSPTAFLSDAQHRDDAAASAFLLYAGRRKSAAKLSFIKGTNSAGFRNISHAVLDMKRCDRERSTTLFCVIKALVTKCEINTVQLVMTFTLTPIHSSAGCTRPSSNTHFKPIISKRNAKNAAQVLLNCQY